MNPVGIVAKTFHGHTAASVLAQVQAAGYRCTEFSLSCCGLPAMPDSLDPATSAGIATAAAESGVTIAGLTGTYNMIHPDPAIRRQGLTRLALLLAHARTMETGLVTLCTGTRDPHDRWHHHPDNEGPEAWSLLLTEMEQAAALADQFDIDLGIQPDMGNVVCSALRAADLLEDIRSPHLCILLDPANLVTSAQANQERIFAEACDLLGDRVAILHARDRNAEGIAVPPGQGIIDFPLFFQRMREVGFAGPVIAHGLEAAEAADAHRFLSRMLQAP